ncbi:hypothetical protein TUBRATIS_21130 [Tubulinosema ratisbonensis]|uniref:Uncharacterized protein n=1 Tax=Tubulinosema ratisbonensis TaxID=291195 RepID=A0A437AK30_9MICR|nr:hypothetical protein TUBRATIS_21130 [Tubulinosema ratisbonensis]
MIRKIIYFVYLYPSMKSFLLLIMLKAFLCSFENEIMDLLEIIERDEKMQLNYKITCEDEVKIREVKITLEDVQSKNSDSYTQKNGLVADDGLYLNKSLIEEEKTNNIDEVNINSNSTKLDERFQSFIKDCDDSRQINMLHDNYNSICPNREEDRSFIQQKVDEKQKESKNIETQSENPKNQIKNNDKNPKESLALDKDTLVSYLDIDDPLKLTITKFRKKIKKNSNDIKISDSLIREESFRIPKVGTKRQNEENDIESRSSEDKNKIKSTILYYKRSRKIREDEELKSKYSEEFDFNTLQTQAMKTFSQRIKCHQGRKIDLNLYKEIDIVRLIKELEDVLPVRLCRVYHHLTTQDFPSYDLKIVHKKEIKDLSVVKDFFDRFIYNKKCKKKFLINFDTPVLNQDFLLKFKNSTKIKKLTEKFNDILYEYIKDINCVSVKNLKNYFSGLNLYFFANDQTVLKKRVILFFEKVLKIPKTKILIDLFPELCVFIDDFKKRGNFIYIYKKIHLFISLLGFKVYLLSENFEYIFKMNAHNSSFVFTDSLFLNYFVFEIRCFLCFYAFNVIRDRTSIKFLLYKTFISFLRISNIKEFQENKFDDYISFEEFKKLKELRFIVLKRNKELKKRKGESSHFLLKFRLTSEFHNYLDGKNKDNISYEKRNGIKQKKKKVKYPIDLKIKEITLKFKEYLEKLKIQEENIDSK